MMLFMENFVEGRREKEKNSKSFSKNLKGRSRRFSGRDEKGIPERRKHVQSQCHRKVTCLENCR